MNAINELFSRHVSRGSAPLGSLKGRRLIWVEILLSIAVVVLPGLLTSAYQVRMLENIAIFALLAIGLNLAFGFTGQISLGHAAFYAVGAYGSAILETRFGLPAIIAWPAAVFLGMLLALLISLPVMRLSGHYLAMATLAFGLIIEKLLSQGGAVTGGHDGIIIPVSRVMGQALQDRFVYVIIIVALIAYWLLRNLTESSVGRSLRALRDDPDGAASLGIPVARYRTLAVVVAGGLAALAGVFYAHVAQVITPEVFAVHTSIQILMMVVIGGMGHRLGGVLGAIVVLIIPELLYGLDEYRNIAFGALVLAVLVFLPRGIAGLPEAIGSLYRKLSSRRVHGSDTAAKSMTGANHEA
jgi:ABC-type branched-subunit amino acid transport system permease subunit